MSIKKIILYSGLVTTLAVGIKLYNENKHLKSSVKASVSYGLKNQGDSEIENKIEMLIKKNVSEEIEVTVHQETDYLQVNAVQKYHGLFPNLFQNNLYEIEVTYYGYLVDNDIIIHKE